MTANVRIGVPSYLEKPDVQVADDVALLRNGSPVRMLPRPSPTMLAARAVQVLERPVRKEALQSTQRALEESRATVRATLLEKARLEQELRSSTLELQHLEAELSRKHGQLATREKELERLRRRNRKGAQRDHRETLSSNDLFADPDDRFRFDVTVCWARKIPAGEKAERPLGPYRLGPRFVSSLEETPGVDRAKVVDVVVEVLTGLADTSAGRQMHVLRTGQGPNEQAVRREDGATCYRVALQRNAPQARRLHFWRMSEEIEFSRVVLHDDYELRGLTPGCGEYVLTHMDEKRSRSTAEVRRATVVAKAIPVFAATGYHATPVTAVADAAGISQAYVFRLFRDKLGLFLAALEHTFDEIERALEAGAVAAPGASPDELLTAMGDAYAGLIADRSLLMMQVHARVPVMCRRSGRPWPTGTGGSGSTRGLGREPGLRQCRRFWPTGSCAI